MAASPSSADEVALSWYRSFVPKTVIATREQAATVETAAAHVYAWNERKRRFSRRQIALAFDVLRAKGWLAAA
jgi:hypothetical protein